MALMNLTTWAKFRGISRVTANLYIRQGRVDFKRYGKCCTILDSEAIIRSNPLATRRGNPKKDM